MIIANAKGVLGLGPRLLQQDNNPVALCNDMIADGCGCCKIVPCKLCLEWELPDGPDADTDPDIDYGSALPNEDGTEWTGSAGGITFRAYIDPNYCTINIELDEVLKYTASLLCLGDQYPGDDINCRDFSDEVAHTDGYDEGIFRWFNEELLELNPVEGTPSTGYGDGTCADFHCGTCVCTCKRLCITFTNVTQSIVCTGILDFSGSYCPNSGKVSAAQWTGSADCNPGNDSISATIDLLPNSYQECEISGSITGTVNGVDVASTLDPQIVSDCKSVSGVWSMTIGYDDYTVSVQCLSCGNCSGINSECCPDVILSETLYVDFIQIAPGPAPGPPGSFGDDCSCASITVPVYGGSLIGLGSEESMWVSGLMSWPCAGPTGNPFSWHVTLTCSANVWTLAISWYENCIQAAKPGEPIFCAEYASSANTSDTSECDPFELTFTDGSPGDIFPSGICIGGLTPAEMSAVVTE